MSNKNIRELIFSENLKMWQVAEKVGISASQFSVWLRTPLNDERKERVLTAIDELKKEVS